MEPLSIVDELIKPIDTNNYYVYNNIELDRDDTYLNELSQYLIRTYLTSNNTSNFPKRLSTEKIMLHSIINSRYFGGGYIIREFDPSNDNTKRIILANAPCKSILSYQNGIKFHFQDKRIICKTKFQHHTGLQARITYTFSKQKHGSIIRELGLRIELYCTHCQHQVYMPVDIKEASIYVNSPKAHEMDNILADILVNKCEIYNVEMEISEKNKSPYIETNYYVRSSKSDINKCYNIIELVRLKIKQVLNSHYNTSHYFNENDIFVANEQ